MASKPNLASIIFNVLKSAGKPMTADAVFAEIQSKSLYEFNSKNPQGIVRNCLSRHSIENTLPNASKKKIFSKQGDGSFDLI